MCKLRCGAGGCACVGCMCGSVRRWGEGDLVHKVWSINGKYGSIAYRNSIHPTLGGGAVHSTSIPVFGRLFTCVMMCGHHCADRVTEASMCCANKNIFTTEASLCHYAILYNNRKIK